MDNDDGTAETGLGTDDTIAEGPATTGLESGVDRDADPGEATSGDDESKRTGNDDKTRVPTVLASTATSLALVELYS